VLLTAEQVAEMLQVPKSWVYEAAREQRIPHIRLGRYVPFEREQLDSWLEAMSAEARTYSPRKVAPRF
jgi:excisionase family DNA binding protein